MHMHFNWYGDGLPGPSAEEDGLVRIPQSPNTPVLISKQGNIRSRMCSHLPHYREKNFAFKNKLKVSKHSVKCYKSRACCSCKQKSGDSIHLKLRCYIRSILLYHKYFCVKKRATWNMTCQWPNSLKKLDIEDFVQVY